MSYYGYGEDRKTRLAREYKLLPAADRTQLEKAYPRKEVTQQTSVTYTSSFVAVIEEAKAFAKQWGKKLEDVALAHSWYDDYGSTCVEVHLEVKGLETDDQWHARLGEQHENNKYMEKREREEYERLSKKFAK